VSTHLSGTERYDPARHDTSSFNCGNELLDRWLTRYAGQNERRDAARTFVATTSGHVGCSSSKRTTNPRKGGRLE